MPLYEYECDACGHRFEVIQKMSDPRIDRCPKCSAAVHKLQSAPAFQFKGTGWYVTDYAKKSGDGSTKGDAGKTDAKAESKSDTKSESKSDAKESSAGSGKTESTSKPASSDPAPSGSTSKN